LSGGIDLHEGLDEDEGEDGGAGVTFLIFILHLSTCMNAIVHLSSTKASFQINGFGGAQLVRAKEMYQFGIIPVDQGVDPRGTLLGLLSIPFCIRIQFSSNGRFCY